MTSPLLAQANFGVFVVFRTGKWGWLLLWVVRIFPPPVIHFPLPVIRGPADITLQAIVGSRSVTPARSKETRPVGCVKNKLKIGSRLWGPELRSPAVAILHDYTAPATLLWRVGVIALGDGAPNVGHHVIP